jgi:integrase/recombinase XerC
MVQQAVKTQGTLFKIDVDYHLWTQAEAFLTGRKVQDLAAGTLRFYRIKLALLLAFCDAQAIIKIDQITPDTLRSFLLWLETTGHNAGGRQAAFRTVKAYLRWWENENEPDGWKNPIRKVKPPKQSTEPLGPVPVADIRKLVDTCRRSWHDERDKAILLTLLDTGVRANELLSLNITDLALTGGAFDVRKGKGNKRRVVFFGHDTKRALRAWLKRRGGEPGALFVTKSGGRLGYDGLRGILTRHAELARIPVPSLHDFRRAFTLAQLQAGVDVLSISCMLGHTTILLVARYAKQTSQELHEKYKSPVDGGED